MAVAVADVKPSSERQYLYRRGGSQCVRQIHRVRRASCSALAPLRAVRVLHSFATHSRFTCDSYTCDKCVATIATRRVVCSCAQFLVKRGFVVLSLSNAIRAELKARGIEESRQALMDMVRSRKYCPLCVAVCMCLRRL